MEEIKRINRKSWLKVFLIFSLIDLILISALYYLVKNNLVKMSYSFYAISLVIIIFNLIYVKSVTKRMLQPLRFLWQTLAHLNQNSAIEKPDFNKLKTAKDLTVNLSEQIIQLFSVHDAQEQSLANDKTNLENNFIAKNLPIPFLVLDDNENVIFANEELSKYIGIKPEDITNKNFYMIMDMSFPSEDTFDVWLKDSKLNTVKSIKNWERVKLSIRDNHPVRLFDLAAYYNKDNPLNQTTLIVIFDHTKQYMQDDQAISFVALGVHELRTPLTLLRGYVEAIKDEINDNGNSDNQQIQNFLYKMDVSAKQMTSFVNNILNVARIDNDQLELNLQSEDWPQILSDSVEAMKLRAKIRQIDISLEIAPNLPKVGVDRISIYEVVSNLIDNAIKYSGQSKNINVRSYLNNEGLIETCVEDFGLGINENILANLFTKYYRDHNNRAQIGGTGLGLYLSKAIVSAHGGNIWVRSKLGQGSSFFFTLLPYDKLNKDAIDGASKEITTTAHGWIKNHSLYRR